MKLLIGIINLLILFLGSVLLLFGIGTDSEFIRDFEQRTPAESPFTINNWRFQELPQKFKKIDDYLVDRFPYRGQFISRKLYFDVSIGFRNNFKTIEVGRDGWLFLKEDSGSWFQDQTRVDTFFKNLGDLIIDLEERGKKVLFVVTPPKQIIYPEYLGEKSISYVKGNDQKLADFFNRLTNLNSERVPDLRAKILEDKAKTNELLYFPDDSHHSFVGSMIMGKIIVDYFSPGLWDSAHFKEEPTTRVGDLVKSLGIRRTENSANSITILREGIETEKILVDQEFWYSSLFYRSVAKNDEKLIGGKTLIINDSFIGVYLRDPLSMFFEDVHFTYSLGLTAEGWNELVEPYDNIVFQSVSRHAALCLSKIQQQSE